jgi:hypothetical protein
LEALNTMASGGWIGAEIYDVLLLRCAARCAVERIYTFNLGDFRQLAAPGLQELNVQIGRRLIRAKEIMQHGKFHSVGEARVPVERAPRQEPLAVGSKCCPRETFGSLRDS